MLLATLRPSLLGSMVKDKRKLRAGYKNNERKEIVRTGYGCLIKKKFWFHHILQQTLKYK